MTASRTFARMARQLAVVPDPGARLATRPSVTPRVEATLDLTERHLEAEHLRGWDPVDGLAWLKAMAWDLKENYTEEATLN